jgi:hypothetical protein
MSGGSRRPCTRMCTNSRPASLPVAAQLGQGFADRHLQDGSAADMQVGTPLEVRRRLAGHAPDTKRHGSVFWLASSSLAAPGGSEGWPFPQKRPQNQCPPGRPCPTRPLPSSGARPRCWPRPPRARPPGSERRAPSTRSTAGRDYRRPVGGHVHVVRHFEWSAPWAMAANAPITR